MVTRMWGYIRLWITGFDGLLLFDGTNSCVKVNQSWTSGDWISSNISEFSEILHCHECLNVFMVPYQTGCWNEQLGGLHIMQGEGWCVWWLSSTHLLCVFVFNQLWFLFVRGIPAKPDWWLHSSQAVRQIVCLIDPQIPVCSQTAT